MKYKVFSEADVINLDITRVDRKKITSYIESALPLHELDATAVAFIIKKHISSEHLLLGDVTITNIMLR